MQVEAHASANDAAWQEFLSEHPDARPEHDIAWLRIFADTYDYEPRYLVVREGTGLAGALPLFAAPVLRVGKCLISVPFLDCGGPLAHSPVAREALLRSAGEMAEMRRAGYLEIRAMAPAADGIPTRTDKAKVVLDLPGDEDALWKKIGGYVRNRVRKATSNGLTVTVDGGERTDAFYSVYARNMRDLGSPAAPRRLFPAVFRHFGDRAKLLTVWRGNTAVAGAVWLHCFGVAYVPWVSALRPYFHMAPNNLLYWEALRLASAAGCHQFDFGRSTIGSGPYTFKLRWGARPVQLHWHYYACRDRPAPSPPGDSRLLKAASNAWMRMPVCVANLLGPRIISRMP